MKDKNIIKTAGIRKLLKVNSVLGVWVVLVAIITILSIPTFYYYHYTEITKTRLSERQFFSKQISELEGKYKIGDSEDIMASTENISKSVEGIIEFIENNTLNLSDIRKLEESTIFAKLGLLQNILSYHVWEGNYDFRILSLNEHMSYSNFNKNVAKKIFFHAKYIGRFTGETIIFKVYLVTGLDPKNLTDFEVKNLISGRNYKKEEIKTKQMGVQTKNSPFCVIEIPLDTKKDMNHNGETKLQISYSTSQSVPYSVYDLHNHRYKRGVETVTVHMQFMPTVELELKRFKLFTFELIEENNEELLKSIISNEVKENNRHKEVVFELKNPKKAIAIIFFSYS